ncbi:hypothetical protein [Nostoc sp.]|uniref:hypothetical protein n=1 Tax=Nostoc sp. TaxID=1180 RepID=UPI002FFB7A8B
MGGFPDLSKLPVAQREESEIFTTYLGLLYIAILSELWKIILFNEPGRIDTLAERLVGAASPKVEKWLTAG